MNKLPQNTLERYSLTHSGDKEVLLALQQVSHLLMLHSGSILKIVGSSV